VAVDVQLQDEFWLKSQQYSLQDMLGNDEPARQFVGGTVYQAFLSATNYHRWHSPVAGRIVRAFTLEGTYYSEADSEGADAVEPQFGGSTHCLVFRPGAITDFSLTAIPQPHLADPPLVRVRSRLATATSLEA
jgi:hypothetical protein